MNTTNNTLPKPNRPAKKVFFEILCKSEMSYPQKFVPTAHPLFEERRDAEQYAKDNIVLCQYRVEPLDILDPSKMTRWIYRKN